MVFAMGIDAKQGQTQATSTPEFQQVSVSDWEKASAKTSPGGDVHHLNWVTPDGITVKPLYTAQDTADPVIAFFKQRAKKLRR